ncbi:unnamed protein product, partial [Ectocarpus fasciculatus]
FVCSQQGQLKKSWKNKRTLATKTLNLARVVCTAFMLWNGLVFVTRCELPVVAVQRGTMEPTFYRGDILFLTNYDDPIRVGEIVLFKVKRRDIFVVHRVIKVHEKSDGQVVDILTKADNNQVNDVGLYEPDQRWLQREEIYGRARGSLSFLGLVPIIAEGYSVIKCALIGEDCVN